MVVQSARNAMGVPVSVEAGPQSINRNWSEKLYSLNILEAVIRYVHRNPTHFWGSHCWSSGPKNFLQRSTSSQVGIFLSFALLHHTAVVHKSLEKVNVGEGKGRLEGWGLSQFLGIPLPLSSLSYGGGTIDIKMWVHGFAHWAI